MTALRFATFLASLLLAQAACRPVDQPARTSPPVVVIGVDGMDPRVVQALLAAGRLPNLARFATEGTLGRLRTMNPTLSPVLWTSIATGVRPEQHGIVDFQDGSGRPFTSNARRAPALWDILSQRERTVNCVGWWVTWPAEPVNGNMVASYAAQAQASVVWKPGTWEQLPDQTWPKDLVERTRPLMIFASDAEEIRSRLWERFPPPRTLDDITRDSVTILGWTFAADLSFAAITADLMQRDAADLNMVYLALPDVAGHRFWSCFRPQDFLAEVPAQKREDFGDYVNLAYAEADRLIGELLAAAPVGANVLLLSDHGMGPFDQALSNPEQPVSGHHDGSVAGIIGAMGPSIRRGGNLLGRRRELGGILDVAPTVLRLLEEPAPSHWPKVQNGLELSRLLEPEWSKEHPLETSTSDDAWFREATSSITPGNGLNRKFISSFRSLGYTLSDPEED